jgi:hypothetical protein
MRVNDFSNSFLKFSCEEFVESFIELEVRVFHFREVKTVKLTESAIDNWSKSS